MKYYRKTKSWFKQTFVTKPPAKKLNVNKRQFASKAVDDIEQKEIYLDLIFIDEEIKKIQALSFRLFGETIDIFDNRLKLLREWKYHALVRLDEIMNVDPKINEPTQRMKSNHFRIDNWTDSEVLTNLNFKTNEQLHSKHLTNYYLMGKKF